MLTRVSCSAFARIKDEHGRILLHIAKRSGNGGGIIMRPLGGPFRTDEVGYRKLIKDFGANYFEGKETWDLRFVTDDHYLSGLQQWFESRSLREITIARALSDQLVGQMNILNTSDVRRLKFRLAGCTMRSGLSPNTEAREVKNTLYLIEVFDVTDVPTAVMAQLKQAATGGKRQLHLATVDEIKAHQGPGDYVSVLADALIHRNNFR